MKHTRDNEIVLTIVDEPPTKYGKHMHAGLQRIAFYNSLLAQEERERQRLSSLAAELKEAPRMPY